MSKVKRFSNITAGLCCGIILLFLLFGCPRVGRASRAPDTKSLLPAQGQHYVFESQPEGLKLDLPDVPNTADVWLAGINAAEDRIRIGGFYITDSSDRRTELTEVLDALVRRARQGVRVEIITDTAVSRPPPRLADAKNIQLREANYSQHTGGVMHAKYMLVDTGLVFTGSSNFDWRSLEHIREIGLAVNDTRLADQLDTLFEIDWELAGADGDTLWEKYVPLQENTVYHELVGETYDFKGGREYQLTASPARTTPRPVMTGDEAVIRLINSARHRLYLDLYDYDNWDKYAEKYWDQVDRALRRAEARGVEIYLQVSSWALGGSSEAYLKSLAVLPNVEVRFLDFPNSEELGYVPYSRTSHPKVLVVDDRLAWVGSTNLAYNYFAASRNVDLVTSSDRVVTQLKRIFLTAYQSKFSKQLRCSENYTEPLR